MGKKKAMKIGQGIVKNPRPTIPHANARFPPDRALPCPEPPGSDSAHHQIDAAMAAAMAPGSSVRTTPFRSATTSAVLTMATVVEVSMPEARKTLMAARRNVTIESAGRLDSALPRNESKKLFGCPSSVKGPSVPERVPSYSWPV